MLVSNAYEMTRPRKGEDAEVISLTRNGKRLLRAAFEIAKSNGRSLTDVAEAIGCSHPHVRGLIHDEETIGTSAAPTWSSKLVEPLCRELGVPLWLVISGLRADHRKVIEAMERVREFTPDRYRAFVALILEQADDRAARGGWAPDESTGVAQLKSRLRLLRPSADDDG